MAHLEKYISNYYPHFKLMRGCGVAWTRKNLEQFSLSALGADDPGSNPGSPIQKKNLKKSFDIELDSSTEIL